MIDRTMMGSMNKRSVNKGSTLRMPAKFSYMTEEEAEYGGYSGRVRFWIWIAVGAAVGGAVFLCGGLYAAHWESGCEKVVVGTFSASMGAATGAMAAYYFLGEYPDG